MTKTVAQASRDWRAKRTATIQRYEAALREIAGVNEWLPTTAFHMKEVAEAALNPEKGKG